MECVHTITQVNTFANSSQNYKKLGKGLEISVQKWKKNNLKVKSQFVAFSAF